MSEKAAACDCDTPWNFFLPFLSKSRIEPLLRRKARTAVKFDIIPVSSVTYSAYNTDKEIVKVSEFVECTSFKEPHLQHWKNTKKCLLFFVALFFEADSC